MEVYPIKQEILVPGLDMPITKEMFYGTVKDMYKNIKGILALQQQFYFSSLNAFKRIAKEDAESMMQIIFTHPDWGELREKLSLAGVTMLDIIVNPNTVRVGYPAYDSRLEYRQVGMYNTVYIKSPPEAPLTIVRIEKKGPSASKLFFVRKKEIWSMKEWSEVILYSDEALFEERISKLLDLFDISQKDYDHAVSSFFI
jgi:hypothetical protein